MEIRFLPYDAETVASLRSGGPDAYGIPAECVVSDGQGGPLSLLCSRCA